MEGLYAIFGSVAVLAVILAIFVVLDRLEKYFELKDERDRYELELKKLELEDKYKSRKDK
jgi:uncharacterized membrane protein YhiD involved in acid resistance